MDVVRWLVKTAGADAQAANTDGCTPLFFACEKGHLGVAQWLVREAGAEVSGVLGGVTSALRSGSSGRLTQRLVVCV